MAGTVRKKVAQLPVLGEPRKIGKIKAWATVTGKAQAVLARDALWGKGWDALERQLIAEYGRELSEAEILIGTLQALPTHLRAEFAREHDLTAELASVGRKAE